MAKYKKKYINLRWFNLVLGTEYKYLYEYYKINYVGRNKAIVKSHRVYKGTARKVYIIQRTSKNLFKVLYIKNNKNIEIMNEKFKKAVEVIEYISKNHRKI